MKRDSRPLRRWAMFTSELATKLVKRALEDQRTFDKMKPTYFNSGCCCFDDGTITGIEISGGFIRLIKWSLVEGKPERSVAEEESLKSLAVKLGLTVDG